MKPRPRHAFTLIELLVVIGVIAVLISLLLPSIKKARLAGWQVVSLANMRNICIAGLSYQEQYKGILPLLPAAPGRGMLAERNAAGQLNTMSSFCTWTHGGKNPRGFWTTYAGGVFDIEAADRPLNPFLTDYTPPAPDRPQTMAATAGERLMYQLPVFRDPTDKVTHQRSWPNPMTPNATEGVIGSYDDVGTSYHYNVKWADFLSPGLNFTAQLGSQNATAIWYRGLRRLRAGEAYSPSRFAWMHDQYADITVYSASATAQVRNGYGDFNRSIMGFMDGHAGYIRLRPGNTVTPSNDNSFINSDYQFIFYANTN
ncbi:MAG TPA: prepilin-type N-terminal cleavage/methylation domain-containing protein [Phycisphaerales bacterium]|nr:prepilin-type N-terminal cleavage/methylation domain-containing protein [Phycisphaerales bacterium]